MSNMTCLKGCKGGSDDDSEWGFLHGVASFDPLPNSVLLWTRVTPGQHAVRAAPRAAPSANAPAGGATASVQLNGNEAGSQAKGEVILEVGWEVALDRDFSKIVASGAVEAGPLRDYTVCVDVAGLEPSTRYFYRFWVPQWDRLCSRTGATKTTASGRLDEMTLAVVSCANWGFGHFTVYDLASRIDDLDVVLHVGDYIYEYEKGNYPERWQQFRNGLRPKGHPCRSLADYRCRYACYRRDEGLQALHAAVPMIAIFDDHEVADSAFRTGAEDFEGTPAAFQVKKSQAMQAYAEWVPIRGLDPARPDPAAAHRTFQFGDLATLVLCENRVSHRSEPLDVSETQFYKETAQKSKKEWDNAAIVRAKAELMRELADPARKMLGEEQVSDLGAAVRESVAAGRPWQLFVSQTIFSTVCAPRLEQTLPLQPRVLRRLCSGALNVASNVKIAGKEAAELCRMYLGMGKYGVPMNPDAWDGYQAERERVAAALDVPGANPVILAGDSHNAWAHEVMDERGHRLAAEFDSPGVTSIGAFEDIHSRFEAKAGWLARMFPLYLFSPWIQDALKAANPDTLQYCNLSERGLVALRLTRRRCHAEFHYVSTVKTPKYGHYCEAAFDVEAGEKGRLHRVARYMTIDGAVPKHHRRRRAAFVQGVHDVSNVMQPV